MQKPETPADEDRRIQTLRSLCVLDTEEDERFDRITRIARRLFDVPIALVSLVDTHRQWFKSRQGLEATETPREVSFCGHAILANQTLYVPDTLNDERFADNPLVECAPNIRFYAGCPVSAPDGHRMGTLCIIDSKPREFDEADLSMLRDLAEMVEAELSTLALATTDQLTGISNRRGFEVLAEHALRMASRRKSPVALVFFDLDDFKEINDTLGHAAGDQALIEISSLLLRIFRDSDVVARMGGDEFGVLMTGIPESEIHLPLERLAQRISERNAQPAAIYAIRYSAGVALHPMTSPTSVAALLAEADSRMYESKRSRKPSSRPASG